MEKVDILILSSSLDFSSDFICFELAKRGISYLRINRDTFEDFAVEMRPDEKLILITINDKHYVLSNEHLISIFFRAPIFLRENGKEASPFEQLKINQWAAFIRAFVILDKPKWVNHPQNTYLGEIKPYQLSLASEVGLKIPKTFIGNFYNDKSIVSDSPNLILKTIDSAVLSISSEANIEGFIYSNIVDRKELESTSLNKLPFILQENITEKIDIRCTVIGNRVFSVRIILAEGKIDGDWRLKKNQVKYEILILPKNIELKLLKITKKIGLNFAAIDLVLSNKVFYFIELNPTGEWAWLKDYFPRSLDKEFADLLSRKK